jgi:hypothetical protein
MERIALTPRMYQLYCFGVARNKEDEAAHTVTVKSSQQM